MKTISVVAEFSGFTTPLPTIHEASSRVWGFAAKGKFRIRCHTGVFGLEV